MLFRSAVSQKDAKDAEMFAIEHGFGYYNETAGGEGVIGLSEEAKQRKSMKLRGKVRSAETRKRMSESKKGHKVSDEARKNMSAARKRYLQEHGPYPMTPDRIDNITNALKGRQVSDEHRANMSNGGKGKVLTDDHRQNIGKGLRKHHEEHPETARKMAETSSKFRHTEESRQKMVESWVVRKQTTCNNTDQEEV